MNFATHLRTLMYQIDSEPKPKLFDEDVLVTIEKIDKLETEFMQMEDRVAALAKLCRNRS